MSQKSFASPARAKRHRSMLWVAALVVAAALVLKVPSPDRVEVAGFPGIPVPGLCLSKSVFGVDCPGCGLTRSLVCFFHGRFAASWRAHRVGWIMAIAVLLQFPYRIAALVRREDDPLGKWTPSAFGYALILLLIGNWLVGFFL